MINSQTQNEKAINQNSPYETLLNRRVYDDVHGFILLTSEEKSLLSTPYFKRLHFIKQNGLANFVFPGATHTRFSHSLGVLYIVEKMVQKLKSLPKSKIDITPLDHQIIRLAALLHDIGHYPLSHTLESSFKNYDDYFLYNEDKLDPSSETIEKPIQNNFLKNIEKDGAKINDLLADFPFLDHKSEFHHEKIGGKLICDPHSNLSKQIASIIKNVNNKFSNRELTQEEIQAYLELIAQIIHGVPDEFNLILKGKKEQMDKYYILSLLVNSDLDADQIDYMMRDTKHTGIQTTIRADFIIDNLEICYVKPEQNKDFHSVLCINRIAFETVQQFIFSKAYWYSEIILYDKVCFLNLVAERLFLYLLLKRGDIKSIEDFYKNLLFDEEKYFNFNDNYFWSELETIVNDENAPKIIKEAILLLKGKVEIPKSLPINVIKNLHKITKPSCTNIVQENKNSEEKEKIYNFLKENLNAPHFSKFFSTKFFKPTLGEDQKSYTYRSIYILLSPCEKEKCTKDCNNVAKILDADLLGTNILHLVFDTKSGNQSLFIEKCIVYDTKGLPKSPLI